MTRKIAGIFLLIPLLAAALALPSTGLAQSGPEDIAEAFKVYREKHYPEKIFLRTDRDLYLTGETVWFKIYCTDGTLHKPSKLSKVTYVELIRDSSENVIQTVIPLTGGKGSGSFYLPTTLRSGNYTIRAYSKWMRNFDEAFFYHRTVTIINPFKRLGFSRRDKRVSCDLTFFPEGGNLIAGQEGRVAFKATDQRGNSIDFSGWLTDMDDNKILDFKPFHAGMGTFTFTPAKNMSYIAHVIGPDSIPQNFRLPRVLPQGLTLRVDPDENEINIRVTASPGAGRIAKLFVHTRNRIRDIRELDLSDGHATLTIDKKKLQPGISHITLFDSQGLPACERLVFVRPGRLLNIRIAPGKNTYHLREKVKLQVDAGLTGKPDAPDLTVSVFRYDDHLRKKGNDLVSYLYLSSDLKGTIEDADYYLGDQQEVPEAVDNLMLTHGWRRFDWNEIIRPGPDEPVEIPEFRNMIINGSLIDKETGQPVADTVVYLSSPGRYLQTYVSKSDSLGKIYFELRKFYGNRQIVLQTQYKPPGGYEIRLNPLFSNAPVQFPAPEPGIGPDWETFITQLSISMQVKNAYFEAQPQPVPATPDTSLFYGSPDERYFLDDFTRFPVMEEVMREYVHGVLVRRRRGHFHFKVIDPENDNIFDEPPLILMDGVPVFQTDRIMAYDPRKIEHIDVLTRKYIIGKKTCYGIVSYNTYAGNLKDFDISDADLVMYVEGLQAKRSFYSTSYDNPDAQQSRIPDYRNLLYWNPDLTTDRSGTSQVEFYSSDEPGTYKIVVEGLTPDGIPGYAETFIEIAPGPEQK